MTTSKSFCISAFAVIRQIEAFRLIFLNFCPKNISLEKKITRIIYIENRNFNFNLITASLFLLTFLMNLYYVWAINGRVITQTSFLGRTEAACLLHCRLAQC